MILDNEIIDILGIGQINKSNYYSKYLDNNNEYNNKQFIKECVKILEGKYHDINRILFTKLETNILYEEYNNIIQILINIFNKYLENCYNEFKNSNISNYSFIDLYNKIDGQTFKFLNMINKIKKHLGNKNKYSLIIMIKDYLFYKIIINNKYNNTHNNIYEYLINDNMVLTEFCQLFITFIKYIRFYNTNNNNLILDTKLIFKKYISNYDNIIEYIFENITDEYINVDIIKNLFTLLANLDIFDIKIDKSLVFTKYKEHMINRIKLFNDLEHEYEILSLFTNIYRNFDEEEISKLVGIIDDYKLSEKYQKHLDEMQVNITTKEYLDMTINKNNIKFTIGNMYNWEMNDKNNIILPREIMVYQDIISKYYSSIYQYRKLECIYGNSYGTIMIDEKEIKMSLLELIVLITINNVNEISALNIRKKTNIKLKDLGPILNQLMKKDLITRSSGNNNDPNILFRMI